MGTARSLGDGSITMVINHLLTGMILHPAGVLARPPCQPWTPWWIQWGNCPRGKRLGNGDPWGWIFGWGKKMDGPWRNYLANNRKSRPVLMSVFAEMDVEFLGKRCSSNKPQNSLGAGFKQFLCFAYLPNLFKPTSSHSLFIWRNTPNPNTLDKFKFTDPTRSRLPYTISFREFTDICVVKIYFGEVKDSDISSIVWGWPEEWNPTCFFKTLPHPTAAMPRLEIFGRLCYFFPLARDV